MADVGGTCPVLLGRTGGGFLAAGFAECVTSGWLCVLRGVSFGVVGVPEPSSAIAAVRGVRAGLAGVGSARQTVAVPLMRLRPGPFTGNSCSHELVAVF